MNEYRTYKDLPALAGIATFEEARRPGMQVDECVGRLKRLHYAFKRLHQIFAARITAEPIYELKSAFSLHAHLCAEHTGVHVRARALWPAENLLGRRRQQIPARRHIAVLQPYRDVGQDRVVLNTPVEALVMEGGRAAGVIAGGK